MAKAQTIKFNDFMDSSWKAPKVSERDVKKLTNTLVKTGVLVPIAMAPHSVFATSGAGETAGKITRFITGESLTMLAHILDPFVEILNVLALPAASIAMLVAGYFFMFGDADKAWTRIMNAGLGYIFIQILPLFLKVLEQVGKSL